MPIFHSADNQRVMYYVFKILVISELAKIAAMVVKFMLVHAN